MSARLLDQEQLNLNTELGRKTFFLFTPLRIAQGSPLGDGGSDGAGVFQGLGDIQSLWVNQEVGGYGYGVSEGNFYGLPTPHFPINPFDADAAQNWLEPVSDSPLNLPFRRRQVWSIGAIFQTDPGGINWSGDPRLYSKDIGSSETDHAFMIGYTGGGYPRCRIGFGGSRCASGGTVLGASPIIIADSRYILVATYDGATLRVLCVRQNASSGNDFTSGSASRSGDVTFNTDATKIGRNAGVSDNYFRGKLECVFGIDSLLVRSDLERLLLNDWRKELLKEPRRIIGKIPIGGPDFPPELFERNPMRTLLTM